jgi:hypothetical protein
MANKTTDIGIKIQSDRYRLTTIKRHKPFESVLGKKNQYGIYVWFTTTGNSARVYHYFETEDEREVILKKLDELFGISF